MNKRQQYWLSLLVLAIFLGIGAYLIYPIQKSTKLGLDLRGGMHVVMVAKDTPKRKVTNEAMDQAEFIIRQRIDKLGVAEPQIERQGDRNLLIQLPGINKPREALKVIGQTAVLEFALVNDQYASLPDDELNKQKKEGKKVLGPVQLTGDQISKARTEFDPSTGTPLVSFSLKSAGSKKFADVTGKNIGKRLAIVLDGRIISAPTIQGAITGGSGQITGLDSADEAKNLSLVLQTGSLPVKLDVQQFRSVGATLGRDSLMKGLRAMIIGFILVALYLFVFYRLFALSSILALAIYGIMIWTVVVAFDVTLTLPGLAGAVLLVGVAADSSIIILERVKDEIHNGKPMRTALETGFAHGLDTFLDADLVTMVTALALFFFGIGGIKGFALILIAGIVADLLVSILFKRSVLGLLSRFKPVLKPGLIGARAPGGETK